MPSINDSPPACGRPSVDIAPRSKTLEWVDIGTTPQDWSSLKSRFLSSTFLWFCSHLFGGLSRNVRAPVLPSGEKNRRDRRNKPRPNKRPGSMLGEPSSIASMVSKRLKTTSTGNAVLPLESHIGDHGDRRSTRRSFAPRMGQQPQVSISLMPTQIILHPHSI